MSPGTARDIPGSKLGYRPSNPRDATRRARGNFALSRCSGVFRGRTQRFRWESGRGEVNLIRRTTRFTRALVNRKTLLDQTPLFESLDSIARGPAQARIEKKGRERERERAEEGRSDYIPIWLGLMRELRRFRQRRDFRKLSFVGTILGWGRLKRRADGMSIRYSWDLISLSGV